MAPAADSLHLLVVDDSPLAQDMLRDALQSATATVQVAASAAAAVERARQAAFDVVVSDLYMPHGSGLSLLEALRHVDPLLPVVIVSSDVTLTSVLGAVRAGAHDYVPKGGDGRVLAAAVHRAAAHSRALRDNARLAAELRGANEALERRVRERTAEVQAKSAELQQLTGRLVAAERLAAIGQLAAGVAHEINNPLAYVVSNLAFVAGGLHELAAACAAQPQLAAELQRSRRATAGRPLLEECGEALHEAEEGAQRIAEIVRDVRSMARTDDRARGKFDVGAAVRAACRIAGEQLRRRAQVQVSLGAPLEVMGSVGRLTQVMINLLVNACDAVDEAPGRPHQIAVRCARQGDQAVIEVQDSGAGITPELLPRIFEPFVTSKPEGRGTGLGLSICADIVRHHGGSLAATSVRGEGATFTVRLPLADP